MFRVPPASLLAGRRLAINQRELGPPVHREPEIGLRGRPHHHALAALAVVVVDAQLHADDQPRLQREPRLREADFTADSRWRFFWRDLAPPSLGEFARLCGLSVAYLSRWSR